jgi:KaiC/GvpD/RAD55 family RecA-like ATPase
MQAEKLLSTGLLALDKELEGGLFPGSLIYVKADPMAMAEIFLYHFLEQRPTYYVNTERKPEFILRNLENLGFKTSGVTFIDIHHKYHEKKEGLLDYSGCIKDYRLLDFLKKQLEAIDATNVNLIVDTITFFLYMNVKNDNMRRFMDTVYNTTKKLRGLGFLYGLKGGTPSHIENELINLCDVVVDISLVRKNDRTVTELVVPKARDRPVRGNILKFKIEKGVIIDTSREIA